MPSDLPPLVQQAEKPSRALGSTPPLYIRPPPSLIWLDPFLVAGLGLAPVVAMIPSNMKLSTGTSALEHRRLALIGLRSLNPRG